MLYYLVGFEKKVLYYCLQETATWHQMYLFLQLTALWPLWHLPSLMEVRTAVWPPPVRLNRGSSMPGALFLLFHCLPVRPDLVKCRHFGNILKVLGDYAGGLFSVGQNFEPALVNI